LRLRRLCSRRKTTSKGSRWKWKLKEHSRPRRESKRRNIFTECLSKMRKIKRDKEKMISNRRVKMLRLKKSMLRCCRSRRTTETLK
jgi:hypothetical protein